MSIKGASGRVTIYSPMNNISSIDFCNAIQSAAVDSPDQNVYLLLDQAGLPGVYQELQKHSVPRVTLFDDTTEKSALAVAPVLILAAERGVLIAKKRLLHWLSRHASDTSSAIFLVSPLPVEVMRMRLSLRLEAELSEEASAIFRFYDSRILTALISILDEVEREAFLGVASTWVYPERSGQLKTTRIKFNLDDAFVAPLKLHANQEFAFVEASEVDQVLDLLRTVIPRKMKECSVPEQFFRVKDLVSKAKFEGIESVLGCSIFCSILLRGGSKVLDSPLWIDIMKELKSGARDMTRLDDLIEDLFLRCV
ncbi:DUF4123 domain-containing protein [Massilia sp. IC2-278]|uniref:DUF4123 domain-containing protein n=1 Tax=Massilia sp. IC2-278 TaxID=2887200 RepID=UPI001E446AAE|nr:DUF4123 domain-containing protein [Massilia sp. IC2-278]MCC2961884.1 DUF4123 domain-containing protein [Massilia sp. IC2-278]